MAKQLPTYFVERYEHIEDNGYGKAGEVEWKVMERDQHGHTVDCVEVWPLRRQAKAHADNLNAAM